MSVKALKCALVVYIRTTFDGEVTNYFLTLVELQDKTGRGIAECILAATAACGLSNAFFQSNLIGFCSDGASSTTGRHSGAAVCLQEILGVQLVSIHCMAHRLELAVHSGIQKIGKLFDVRWLMSSYSAVRALWNDLAPLQLHMTRLADDASLSGKEKAKFRGLKRQLGTWLVIAEIALMKDTLEELSHFSLYLQHRDANILHVGDHLTILIRTLKSMKTDCGRALKLPMTAVEGSSEVDDHDDESQETDVVAVINGSNVKLRNPTPKDPTPKDREMFDAFRRQFLQGLLLYA